MRNEVDDKYAALLERLCVLDKDGRGYYQSVMGLTGFDVDAWLKAVQEQTDHVNTAVVDEWITSDRHGQ